MATLVVEIDNENALRRLEELQTLGILRIQNHRALQEQKDLGNSDGKNSNWLLELSGKMSRTTVEADAKTLSLSNSIDDDAHHNKGNVAGLMGTMSRTTVEDTERQLKEMREEWD